MNPEELRFVIQALELILSKAPSGDDDGSIADALDKLKSKIENIDRPRDPLYSEGMSSATVTKKKTKKRRGRPKAPEDMVQFSNHLPESLLERLKTHCAESGTSRAFVLRCALTDWLDKHAGQPV